MANGSDEIEFVTIVDILRRAKVNVVVASIEKSLQILASHGTRIIADKLINIAAESVYDLIIIPVRPFFLHSCFSWVGHILDFSLLSKECINRIYSFALC